MAAPGYSGRAGWGAVGRPVGGLVRLSRSAEGCCPVVVNPALASPVLASPGAWTMVSWTEVPVAATAVACTAVACTAVACTAVEWTTVFASTVFASTVVAAGSPPLPPAPAVTSGWVCWVQPDPSHQRSKRGVPYGSGYQPEGGKSMGQG